MVPQDSRNNEAEFGTMTYDFIMEERGQGPDGSGSIEEADDDDRIRHQRQPLPLAPRMALWATTNRLNPHQHPYQRYSVPVLIPKQGASGSDPPNLSKSFVAGRLRAMDEPEVGGVGAVQNQDVGRPRSHRSPDPMDELKQDSYHRLGQAAFASSSRMTTRATHGGGVGSAADPDSKDPIAFMLDYGRVIKKRRFGNFRPVFSFNGEHNEDDEDPVGNSRQQREVSADPRGRGQQRSYDLELPGDFRIM